LLEAAAGGLGVAAGGLGAAASGLRAAARLGWPPPSPTSSPGLSLSRRLRMVGREKDKFESSSRGEDGF